jgi:arginyl-tRNA synthetase
VKSHLQTLLRTALEPVLAGSGVTAPDSITIDPTRDTKHGDFATNLALALAKPLGKPPRAVAEALIKHLPASKHVSRVEIAGPGFINFFLAQDAFQSVVPEILKAGGAFGRAPKTRGKVMVEFVSANPTGPLHVGHGRNAAYGDSLANVLDAAGYDVLREYYINDAGRQVDVLAVSVWLRYLELLGETVVLPSRGYPGDYIRAIAQKLHGAHARAFHQPAAEIFSGLPPDPAMPDAAGGEHKETVKAQQESYLDALIARARQLLGAGFETVQRFALDDQLKAIRTTLENFGVRYDRWYSERALVESGAAGRARQKLKDSGLTYEKDGAVWFKTQAHGDEKDRVLVKSGGAPTYFGNDLAYHVDKLSRVGSERGWLINVWGADHHGLLARMRAAMTALTGRPDAVKIQVMQFVTLSSGRMGKRSGNFVTLDELVREAGTDETRFFYLLRSHEQHLEFDIELARSKTNDNPVYYVQYGCARVASVFRQAAERGLAWDAASAAATLHRLSEPHEKALLTQLARFPEMIQDAAEALEPHRVAFYLREVADAFHTWYNAHQFLVDDAELRNARLALVAATGQVFKNGLALLGVSAPEKM